jgi:zinc transporter ZupT
VSEQSAPSTGGRVAAIVLLVLQAFSVLLFGGLGLFIAFISDSCGASSTCDSDRIALGMMTPLGVSVLLFVVSLVQVVLRMRADRSVWWVPIVWTVLSAGGVVLGFVVAESGVAPNGSLV